MKRLIKKSSSMLLYHGTSLENFTNIMSMGKLSPQEGVGDGLFNDQMGGYEGRVFLATNIEIAKDYAISIPTYNPFCIVIECDIEESRLLPDNQVTNSEDWNVSMYYFGQVSVEGEVNINSFRDIHFYDMINGREVFVTQANNWEEKYLEYYTIQQ